MAVTASALTLRTLMAERGFKTARALAARAGVHESQISKLMNGWSGSERVVAAVARALGVTPSEVRASIRRQAEIVS